MPARPSRSIVDTALRYSGVVFLLGFALGTLRVFLIAPHLGPVIAVLLELPLMLAFSWWLAGALLRTRPRLRCNQPALIAMGALAFLFLLLAEAALGITGFGLTPTEYLAGYSTLSGQIGLAGQFGFALIPWLHR